MTGVGVLVPLHVVVYLWGVSDGEECFFVGLGLQWRMIAEVESFIHYLFVGDFSYPFSICTYSPCSCLLGGLCKVLNRLYIFVE